MRMSFYTKSLLIILFGACCSIIATAQPGTPVDVVPIPWVPFQIAGSVGNPGGSPINYRAYTVPGDPFRIVVEESNLVDEALIYAKYAGFKAARQTLIDLVGIDARAGAKPIDIFITATTWTGPYQPGITTGYAGNYGLGSGMSTGYIALFDVEKNNRILEFTPENACRIEDELLAVHEYAHHLFYGRSFCSYEDYAKALSFYVCGYWDAQGLDPENFPQITDPTDEHLNQLGSGKLIYELGTNFSANWGLLRTSLRGMVKLFADGGGEAEGDRVSVNQYHWILNGLIGKDTKPAFLAAGHDPSDLSTRSLYFPYVSVKAHFRPGFRFAVPTTVKGDVQGLLYFYDAKGKPYAMTLSSSGKPGFLALKYHTSDIHPTTLNAQSPLILTVPEAPDGPAKYLGWARYDSLVAINASMAPNLSLPALPNKSKTFVISGVPASTRFTFHVKSGDQTIAIVNPGNQVLTLRLKRTLLWIEKGPSIQITLHPGQQIVATVSELTDQKTFTGNLRIQGDRKFAAMIFPTSQ